MKAILVNDTGKTSNPGCRLVRKGFDVLFSEEIDGVTIHDSVPVHYWTDHFREIGNSGRSSLHVEKGHFPTYVENSSDIDVAGWEAIRKRLLDNDPELINKINASDCVIVNAEGSIHHNTGSALAVLALTKVGIELGKKVLLVNATIMAMTNTLLIDVLKDCELIHVRDDASCKYLKSLGLTSFVAPDVALLGFDDDENFNLDMQISQNSVLVTAGVAIRRETLEFLFDKVETLNLIPVYLSIGDGGESKLAAEVCDQFGIKIIHAQKLQLRQMYSLFRRFQFAISGRHHMNIVFMRSRLPFLPITTNTWKIKECMKLLEYPLIPAVSYYELSPILKKLLVDREFYSTAAEKSYCIGRRKMEPLIKELKKCI